MGSSWELAHNDRHNGMPRDYIPKGKSIERYADEEILSFADMLNCRPRRLLGYYSSDDLFESFLDSVYASWYSLLFIFVQFAIAIYASYILPVSSELSISPKFNLISSALPSCNP